MDHSPAWHIYMRYIITVTYIKNNNMHSLIVQKCTTPTYERIPQSKAGKTMNIKIHGVMDTGPGGGIQGRTPFELIKNIIIYTSN